MIADFPLQHDSLRIHLPRTLRDYLKQVYIYGKTRFAPPFAPTSGVHFLYGHFLFADEEANFRRVMEMVMRTTTIISYSEAVQRVATGEFDKAYTCFSFDDGMLNNRRIADFFQAHGLSAMFFVNPEVVENADNKDYTDRHSIERLNKKSLDFFGWNHIEQLLKAGHEIGNHGLRHQRLSALSHNAMQEEVGAALELLQHRTGLPAFHYAWTYGMASDIPRAAAEYVHETGHLSLTSAMRGHHHTKLDLKNAFLLRDQLIFGEPMYYLPFFYRINPANYAPTMADLNR